MTGARDSVRQGGRVPAVIVVSSHVVRGSVGNRVSVFALETMGYPVWAVPTIILPWHPGHGRANRIVPAAGDFAALMHDVENAPWLGEVGAVLSGYLGDATQADAIASLVKAVKRRNPDAIYLCDPIMGDRDGLYVPQAVAAAQRDRLMPIADIATPNRYELAWMGGAELDSLDSIASIAAFAAKAGPRTMLVTSAPGDAPRSIANLLLTPEETYMAEHPAIENPLSGTGDVLAALFLAWLLGGAAPSEALRKAAAAVYEVVTSAAGRGADELMLETDVASFTQPGDVVTLCRLARVV